MSARLPFSEEEIRTLYRDAKNKRQQVRILAEMNCTNEDVIREILGIQKPAGRARKTKVGG